MGNPRHHHRTHSSNHSLASDVSGRTYSKRFTTFIRAWRMWSSRLGRGVVLGQWPVIRDPWWLPPRYSILHIGGIRWRWSNHKDTNLSSKMKRSQWYWETCKAFQESTTTKSLAMKQRSKDIKKQSYFSMKKPKVWLLIVMLRTGMKRSMERSTRLQMKSRTTYFLLETRNSHPPCNSLEFDIPFWSYSLQANIGSVQRFTRRIISSPS